MQENFNKGFIKTTLFLLRHITQQNAEAPTSTCLFSFPPNWFNHPSNILSTLRDGVILKANYDKSQMNLVYQHSKNKCLIVSFLWQKQHCFPPFQFSHARLSFVKITSLYMYHINILIFKWIFRLHIILFRITISLLIKARYKEWTKNLPCWCKFQRNKSALFKQTSTILLTRWCQSTRLFSLLIVSGMRHLVKLY
jgi:hypothetical protein